jgi:hypothetical protein
MASEKGLVALKQGHAWTRNKATVCKVAACFARELSSTPRNCELKSGGTLLALSGHQRPARRLVREGENVMNRKNTRSKVRLVVKKETLKDLSINKPVLGGRKSVGSGPSL